MALAKLEDLSARLEDEITSQPNYETIATNALADLSDDANFYGSASWTDTSVPSVVKSIILRAASRYMKNPDAFTQSRAGDETLAWSDQRDDQAGSAHFAESEIKQIESVAAGNSAVPQFGSVGTYAWNSSNYPPFHRRGYDNWPNVISSGL